MKERRLLLMWSISFNEVWRGYRDRKLWISWLSLFIESVIASYVQEFVYAAVDIVSLLEGRSE
jgi:hypothetical protein